MQIRSKICKRPRKITEKLEEKRKTKGSRKRILNSTEKHKHRTTTRLDYFLCVVRSIYFFLGGVFRCLSYAFCKPQRIMHEFKLSLYCFSQPSGLVCVFFFFSLSPFLYSSENWHGHAYLHCMASPSSNIYRKGRIELNLRHFCVNQLKPFIECCGFGVCKWVEVWVWKGNIELSSWFFLSKI